MIATEIENLQTEVRGLQLKLTAQTNAANHWFTEANKEHNLNDKLKRDRDALLAALKIFAIVGGPTIDPDKTYVMCGEDIEQARAAIAAAEKD